MAIPLTDALLGRPKVGLPGCGGRQVRAFDTAPEHGHGHASFRRSG